MYTTIGIVGAMLVLFGFYRTSSGKWSGRSLWFELDNLIGAILLLTYQLHHKAYITVVLNFIWAFVAFRGLSSYAERHNLPRKALERIESEEEKLLE